MNADITLICETCRLPIARGEGSIYVQTGDLREHRDAVHDWREAHPEGTAVDVHELLKYPEEIHWRTGHDACRSDRDEGCYEIDDDRIASWTQLAWWTSHLMGKNWLAFTDWDDVLSEAAGSIPAVRLRIAVRESA